MADLLRSWVRSLGVESECEDFEGDFANGYALGEVMHACGLQPDFAHFQDDSHPDAMINNFTRLHPTMTQLGVPFDARVANRVMLGEAGVVPQILYQVRMQVTGMERDIVTSKADGKLAKTLHVTTKPTLTLLEARANSTKAPFDEHAQYSFEKTIRHTSENPNAIRESMVLSPFTRQGELTMEVADNARDTSRALANLERDERRAGLLDKMSTKRTREADALGASLVKHRGTMRAKRNLEREELRVELALATRARARDTMRNSNAADDTSNGIAAFEQNLKRLGADQGRDLKDEEAVPVKYADPLEHLRHVSSLAPEPEELATTGKAYLSKIQAAKADESAARRERERRRRKVLLEQARAQEMMEERGRHEAVVTTLGRISGEEHRVAMRLAQLRKEADVMSANRALRERQYKERRDADHDDALLHDMITRRHLQQQYEHLATREVELWEELERKRVEAEEKDKKDFCSALTVQLVGLAENAIEYRERTDAKVPAKEYRDWVSKFVNGIDLTPPLLLEEEAVPEEDLARKALDEATLADYLKTAGEWVIRIPILTEETGEPLDPPEETIKEVGRNDELGVVLANASVGAMPEAAERKLPNLSFPCRVALTGAPVSGKTMLSRKLAESQNLKLFNVEELSAKAATYWAEKKKAEEDAAAAAAAAAAEEAEANGLPPPEPAAEEAEGAEEPELSAYDALAKEISETLEAGTTVSDEALVKLLVLAIDELPLVPEDPEEAAEAFAKEGDDHVYEGFALDGFPRTAAQAEILERELTGLDLTREAEIKKRTSVIAPPPAEHLEKLLSFRKVPYTSGLDAVIVLSIGSEDVAIKRALGRRVDPETGNVYHLDFDPPPDKLGLSDQLEEDDGDSNVADVLQDRLVSARDDVPELETWLDRFDSLKRPVDSNPVSEASDAPASMVEVVKGEVESIVTSIKAAKVAARQGREAEQAARDARALAIQADENAKAARADTEKAAGELLLCKQAEIAASQIINSKGEDEASTKMLELKSSEAIAEHLKACKEATERADAAATAANTAAADAEAAAESADQKREEAVPAAEAKDKAQAAKEAAHAACEDAKTHAGAARESLELSQKALAKAERVAAGEMEEEEEEAKEEEEPEPEPYVAVAEELRKDAATVLHSIWVALEQAHVGGLKTEFYSLRTERSTTLEHYAILRRDFMHFLARPDTKQKIASDFQRVFNAVDMDLRRNKEAKAELLLRGDELRDTLWDVCDLRLEENEAELAAIRGDSWAADHSRLLGMHFRNFVQLECDRYVAACQTLKDYHADTFRLDINEDSSGGFNLEDAEAEVEAGTLLPPAPEETEEGKGAAEGSFPEWTELLADLPEKLAESVAPIVAAVKAALCAPTILARPPPEAEEAAAAEGDAAEGEGEEVDEAELEKKASHVEAARVAAEEGLKCEAAMLAIRLEGLLRRVKTYVLELVDVEDRSLERLVEWLKKRYTSECAAVEALAATVRDAVRAETDLPIDLRLEGEFFVVDELTLAMPEPRKPPPPPPQEPEPLEGTCSCAQLSGLASALHTSASSGFLGINEAVEVILRQSNDMAGKGIPAAWWNEGELMRRSFDSSLRHLYDTNHSGYVEVVEVLASLFMDSVPAVPAGGAEQFVEARSSLLARDADADGCLTRAELAGASLWFDEGPSESGYDMDAARRDALWSVFSENGKLDVQRMLVHLSADKSLATALRKSLCSMGMDVSAPLSSAEWFSLLYPAGRAAGIAIGRAPLDGESLGRLLVETAGTEGAEVLSTEGGAVGDSPEVHGPRVSVDMMVEKGISFVETHLSRLRLKDFAASLRA